MPGTRYLAYNKCVHITQDIYIRSCIVEQVDWSVPSAAVNGSRSACSTQLDLQARCFGRGPAENGWIQKNRLTICFIHSPISRMYVPSPYTYLRLWRKPGGPQTLRFGQGTYCVCTHGTHDDTFIFRFQFGKEIATSKDINTYLEPQESASCTLHQNIYRAF